MKFYIKFKMSNLPLHNVLNSNYHSSGIKKKTVLKCYCKATYLWWVSLENQSFEFV